MSISYSGIVNYGKAILPSVDNWGTNNNILRDPPKSITTRRIDKVSETSMLDQEVQESGNRVAESIRVYPRGINPMVGVSFDNNGSNGGNRQGQGLLYAGGQQTKLPYRVAKDGAFRPPVLTQQNLYPLSRLPRIVTKINPIANTVDFKRKILCPGKAKDYRSVKNNTLQVKAEGTVLQKIQKPTPINTKQNINTNVLTMKDINALKSQNIQRPVEVSVGQNIQGLLLTRANTTKVQNIQRPMEVSVGQNIQDVLLTQADTTKIQSIQRPVEVSVGQNIQSVLLTQADTTKIQNIQRPMEVSVGQNIQGALLTQADTTKIQNIQRPMEVSVGQNIQDILLAKADTTKIQNIQRPVEVSVGQNIQHQNLLVNARTSKIKNIQRPVEVSVGQNIQNNNINIKDVNSGKQLRKDYSNHSSKYTGDSVKIDTLHIDANVNPSQNVNIKTVESKIIYRMSERPQSFLSNTSNAKGVTKHVHHQVHEFREKPSLTSEVHANSSYRGLVNPKEQLKEKEVKLPDTLNKGEMNGIPFIPTFDRTNYNKKLKSGTFFELMKNNKL
jgi:hypothetical protein